MSHDGDLSERSAQHLENKLIRSKDSERLSLDEELGQRCFDVSDSRCIAN